MAGAKGGIRIMPWFRREDYRTFVVLAPRDPDLPPSFDLWLKQASKDVEKEEARGRVCKKVVVDPNECARWCQATKMPVNYATIRGYAIAKALQERDE